MDPSTNQVISKLLPYAVSVPDATRFRDQQELEFIDPQSLEVVGTGVIQSVDVAGETLWLTVPVSKAVVPGTLIRVKENHGSTAHNDHAPRGD